VAVLHHAAQHLEDFARLFLARATEFVVALTFGWGVLAWLKRRGLRREHTS
jgi:hypothetical protein